MEASYLSFSLYLFPLLERGVVGYVSISVFSTFIPFLPSSFLLLLVPKNCFSLSPSPSFLRIDFIPFPLIPSVMPSRVAHEIVTYFS